MKPAPGFKAWPDPVNGMWKIELLRWLGQITGITTLVETGTCEGVTPWNLKDDFKYIHTIELHDGLFESAKKRLSEYRHILQYHGSSKYLLDRIILQIGMKPVLFWLDAHSSGPHTADDGDPLPEEIRIITSLCPNALIVVDDMRGLDEFKGQVGARFPTADWHCEYRTGEIIAYKKGRYNIPEFEHD